MGALTHQSPRPIRPDDDISTFSCGRPILDDWLKIRAWRNEDAGASRTYVVCDDVRVAGYYALATGAVEAAGAQGRVRRNMPDPIPLMVLGRLAVDVRWQGRGIGHGLLKDAIVRTLRAADVAGIRALLVHALDEEAARFYRANGFIESPIDPLVLMLPLAIARRALT